MKKSYFTLIGLVIVILIISVLTCLMINAYFFKSLSDAVNADDLEQTDDSAGILEPGLEPAGSKGRNQASNKSVIDAANQAKDAYNRSIMERQKQYDMLK